MFTKQQTKETVAEYEERLRLEMVGEFQRRMKFAKAHYFEKKCDDHCPHLERIVDLDSMDRSTPFTALPPEILFHIATQVRKGKQLCLLLSSCKLLAAIGRHPTLLKRKKGCDCEAKEAGNDGKEKVCDRCKKEYCDDGNGDPVWIEKIQKVKEKIDSIMEKADVFMHGYHTCHNENLNMCRTKDTPKDKNMPTFGERAFLSPLRRNLGGRGSATATVFEELGLEVTTSVQQHLDNLDEQEKRNRKRKQIEEVSKLKGKALEAQITLFGLFKTYKGDSTAEGQKKRLAEFVSDQSAFQHYLRPHKPRATAPHCSSPLPSAPFSAVVVARSRSSAV
ncbi:hypothetical protein QOT17_016280 [Balamuthia mandrillaris]